MDFSAIPLFDVMRTKLNYMSERQSVLAQNVANADTPGYQAMDIAEPDFKKIAASGGAAQNLRSNLPMTITDPKHIAHGATANGDFKAEKRKSTYELNPNGNNVVIEEEMSKIAKNQADYQETLNLYGKWISMLKTAIGNSSTGS